MVREGARFILAARFTFYCMEIGLAKSFGVLVPELEEQLQTSNAIVGLITSLSLAVMCLGSPIAKIMLHRCPYPRILTSTCGLVAGSSLVASSFTRNLLILGPLFITLGLCCSVINLQALVLLHEYYQEDFPFVSCISVLGIPFGAAILPPITEKFLEHYGLSGALLILGGLILNMVPIGQVLKVPKTSRSVLDDKDRNNLTKLETLLVKTPEETRENSKYSQLSDQDDSKKGDQKIHSQTDRYGQRLKDNFVMQNGEAELESKECTVPSNCARPKECPQICNDTLTSSPTKDTPETSLLKTPANGIEVIRPLHRRNPSPCLTFFHIDVLIKEPLFSLFYLPCVFLLFLVTGGWALFIVVYALDHGIDIARGTYLATSGAVGGIISSILMSIGLRYRPELSPYYWIANQALYAVMIFLQVLHSSYAYLLVMSFFIGFGLFGVNVVIEAVLSEVVEKENFPDAGNLFFFAVGIGYISAGYISGFVQDRTGNSKMLFIFLGVMSMIGLILFSAMVILFKRRQTMNTKDSDETEDHQADESSSL
ncbi:uncharacterized protein LOC121407500 [Lytechinus variegatus]|uniref:uncharacterized protein LOC121407500 n=1 Tax=Lytechinus variegatus TaxID=7654 RepID=UPI001BB107D6|nr:uncharacterized protein LOC121407500 [Lytechinus variegatus]XP_041454557.1 uncharacterized protein LOC121407500 [Lytechinus variegatus]